MEGYNIGQNSKITKCRFNGKAFKNLGTIIAANSTLKSLKSKTVKADDHVGKKFLHVSAKICIENHNFPNAITKTKSSKKRVSRNFNANSNILELDF